MLGASRTTGGGVHPCVAGALVNGDCWVLIKSYSGTGRGRFHKNRSIVIREGVPLSREDIADARRVNRGWSVGEQMIDRRTVFKDTGACLQIGDGGNFGIICFKWGLLDILFDPGNSGLGDVSDMATSVVNLGHKELVCLPDTFVQVRKFLVKFLAKHCRRRGGHAVKAFFGSRDAGFQGDKVRGGFFTDS